MAADSDVRIVSNNADAVIQRVIARVAKARDAELDAIYDDIYPVVPVDEGDLRAGLHKEIHGALAGEVATSPETPYAVNVHDGTSRQRAQPFTDQARENARRRFPKRLADALKGK
jgi:hypothetical protein